MTSRTTKPTHGAGFVVQITLLPFVNFILYLDMTTQSPKRHHFVPECYLKKFIREESLYVLNMVNLKNGHNEFVRKKMPAQICYRNNYYKIEEKFRKGQFGLESYGELFIESNLLHRIESKYNLLFANLITSQAISLADAINWSDFIIQMKIRNPYFMERTIAKHQNNWIDDSMRNIYKSFSNDHRYAAIPDEIKKYVNDVIIENNKNDTEFSKKMQLAALVNRNMDNIGGNEKYRNAIINCQWNLLFAETEPFFITSDNPGFSVTIKDKLTYNTRFTDGFSFYFPLSPNYCLFINDFLIDNCYSERMEHKAVTTTPVSKDFVIWINNRTIQLINQLLIASNDWYLSQILKLNKPQKLSKIDSCP